MTISWQKTAPGFGYGGIRRYGGASVPPGGRTLKVKASQALKEPVRLLTQQQANDRLRLLLLKKANDRGARVPFRPRVPELPEVPRVPGLYLKSPRDPGCHLKSGRQNLNRKNSLNFVKQEEMELRLDSVKQEHVSVKQEESQMELDSVLSPGGGGERDSWRMANESLIILDHVFKSHDFPIWRK